MNVGPFKLLLAVDLAAALLLTTAAGCQDSRLPAAPQLPRAGSPGVAGGEAPAANTVGAARRQPIRDISFDTVKLKLRKGDPFHSSLLTPQIHQLDGRRIRVRGYILPPFQQTGLIHFVLVRDNMSCCFGPGAAIYDAMVVDLQPGLTTDYTISPVTVEGTFHIHEVRGPGGDALSIYHLTAEKVQ